MEKEARIHRVSAADAPVAGGRTSRDRMLVLALVLLNVSCTIEPDPAKAQQQIDRLEQTLNELPAKSD